MNDNVPDSVRTAEWNLSVSTFFETVNGIGRDFGAVCKCTLTATVCCLEILLAKLERAFLERGWALLMTKSMTHSLQCKKGHFLTGKNCIWRQMDTSNNIGLWLHRSQPAGTPFDRQCHDSCCPCSELWLCLLLVRQCEAMPYILLVCFIIQLRTAAKLRSRSCLFRCYYVIFFVSQADISALAGRIFVIPVPFDRNTLRILVSV